MASSQQPSPPRTPSPKILNEESHDCNGFEFEGFRREPEDPFGRRQITAGSAESEELSLLYQLAHGKLVGLAMTRSGNLVVTRAPKDDDSISVGSDNSQSPDTHENPPQLRALSATAVGSVMLDAHGDAPYPALIETFNDENKWSNDPAMVLGMSRSPWESPLQPLLDNTLSSTETTFSSPAFMSSSAGSDFTPFESPNEELQTAHDAHDLWASSASNHNANAPVHDCKLSSVPRRNIFGCGDTEICVIYDSESQGSAYFMVCGEKMKSVSKKWASRRFLLCTSRMPTTVVANSDNEDVVHAARCLFRVIHNMGDDESWFRPKVLSQMTAIAMQLGCKSVIDNLVQKFLLSVATESWGLFSTHDIHHAIYLALQFGHEESFAKACRDLAIHHYPRHSLATPSLWAGRITEPFVHMAIVPILHAIDDVYLRTTDIVIAEVENSLHGRQWSIDSDEDSYHGSEAAEREAAARRELRSGLVASDMWPLNKNHNFSLQTFIEQIKEAGGDSLENLGAGGEYGDLVGFLENIVEEIEFSIHCF